MGDLRWRAPQPVKPWPGERRADQLGPRCMQTSGGCATIDPLNPRMSEDCLYLNVWTPAKAAGDRLPVMVWIYGGGFNDRLRLRALYDGANLAKKGVIVVTAELPAGRIRLPRPSGTDAGKRAITHPATTGCWTRSPRSHG